MEREGSVPPAPHVKSRAKQVGQRTPCLRRERDRQAHPYWERLVTTFPTPVPCLLEYWNNGLGKKTKGKRLSGVTKRWARQQRRVLEILCWNTGQYVSHESSTLTLTKRNPPCRFH